MIWGSWSQVARAVLVDRERRPSHLRWLALACTVFACSSGSSEQTPEDVGESAAALCSGTTIVASPASPIPLNGTTRLTASASCSGPAQYSFAWQLPGSDATTYGSIQGWSSANFADWNTTGPSGAYNVYAYSSTNGGTTWNSVTIPLLVGRVCGTSTLAASPPASTILPLGTPITFSPSATCSYGGTPEYQVFYMPLGQTELPEYVQVLAPDQQANSWTTTAPTLDTTSLRSGKYSFYVRTRAKGNVSVRESWAYTPSSYLLGDVCRQVTLTASPSSPRPGGPSVTLVANAVCNGSAVPELLFSYKKTTDTAYTFMGSWTRSPSVAWNTSNLPAGDYQLQVYARAVGNLSPNEAYTVVPFKLTTGIPALPPLQYREVTYARDATDYFSLPTLTPLSTPPVSPSLRRSNRFFFNLPTTKPLPLTFTVGNTTAASNPAIDITVYNSAGTAIKTAVLPSDYIAHTKTTTVSLPNIGAGNYEIDVAPRDPALTYTLSTDVGVTLALSNGADLADAGTLHFFVPAETDTAFLVGTFDSGTPVQFVDPSGTTVTATAITPQVYSINTHAKPGVWRTTFRTQTSAAHFINLPDVFSFQSNSVIASKRIRTSLDYGPPPSSPLTLQYLRHANRFVFHLNTPSSPSFNIAVEDSYTQPPPSLQVRLLDMAGAQLRAPFSLPVGPTNAVSAGTLQAGDYELHVVNPLGTTRYLITAPANVKFVGVDDFDLGNVWLASYRDYFYVPPGTTSVRFHSRNGAAIFTVYDQAGAEVAGQPIALGNNIFEVQNTTPGTWALNVKGATSLRFLNIPQVIGFEPNARATPGGPRQCTSDASCAPGEVCGTDNGSRFGLPASADVCWPATCSDGVQNAGEVAIDCGGACPLCGAGQQCGADGDCGAGLVCGTNNGGYFGGQRATRVCWPTACQDGVVPGECGQPNSLCGQNCAGVVECDASNPGSVCPSGEVCKSRLGRLFGATSPDVCVSDVCPSNDPALAGSSTSLCGTQTICTPDCSHATAANPKDGCGGECKNVCANGQACCTQDLHCPVDSFCQAQASGPGICRPNACAYRHLEPPLCGTPNAVCGNECPACTPECNGRQCGLDPACGVSCGTCGANAFCSDGQCMTVPGDAPVKVLDGSGEEQELPNLPEGPTAPVGALAGQFSVSDQGGALYNIPIDVPPGRAGLEPALSLQYAGSKANGLAGIGWSLEGLSQITRCPRVHALDGYAAPIKNDETDRFCIDGKRLETISGSAPYGTNNAEYRTLVDTFTKVVTHTDLAGDGYQLPPLSEGQRLPRNQQGPDSFTVYMKDGRILTYGASRDSLVMEASGARVAWLLNRIADHRGNNIVITYSNLRAEVPDASKHLVPNLVRPKAIFYTGYGVKTGSREVRFDYETRFDGQLSYGQGSVPLLVPQRLSRITTYVDGNPVKNYRLEYLSDEVSQLKRVKECVHDQESPCKGSTDFQYVPGTGHFTQAPGWQASRSGQLDANGDGLPDFLLTTATVNDVPENKALIAAEVGADIAVNVAAYAANPIGGLAINVVWLAFRGPIFGAFAEEPTVTFNSQLFQGTGNRAAPFVANNNVQGLPCSSQSAAAFFVDYNLDGKDDVLSVCGVSTPTVGIASGADFNGVGSGILGQLPLYHHSHPVVYDVDGDSLADMVSCADQSTLEVRLRISPDEAFRQEAIQLKAATATVHGAEVSSRLPYCGDPMPTYRAFDVDGDGTSELLAHFARTGAETLVFGEQQGWFALRLGRDAGGLPSLSWEAINFPDTDQSDTGDGLLLADLNGDGLTDIWRDEGRKGPPSASDEATVWLNAGGRFLARTIHRPSPFGNGTSGRLVNTVMLDYDGDGRLDILSNWAEEPSRRDVNQLLQTRRMLSELSSSVHPPDLVIADPAGSYDGSFASVGDIDGDGNDDLFGGLSGRVFYGSGAHNMLLSKVIDGIGNYVEVEYDAGNPYTATCTHERQWPERCLKTLKGLVSGHKEGSYDPTSGFVPERTYSYKYANARVNVTGHGWIGFDTRAVTETVGDQQTTVTTTFEPVATYAPSGAKVSTPQPNQPYLYPLAGLARVVTVDQGTTAGVTAAPSLLEDAVYSRRTVVSNQWNVRLSADGRPYPSLDRQTTETFARPVEPSNPIPFENNGVLRTSCTVRNASFDGYGNVTDELRYCGVPGADSVFDVLEYTSRLTSYQIERSAWLVSNADGSTVTSDRGDPSQSQTQTFSSHYDPSGQLEYVTRDPSGQAQTTTYTRDPYGNIKRVEETGASTEPSRVTTIDYDSEHVFPTTVTRFVNGLALVWQLQVEPGHGQIWTTADPNKVAVRNRYDGFGRPLETQSPTGISQTTYAMAMPWGASSSPAGGIRPRIEVVTETRGADNKFGGRSVALLDNYGRVVRSTTLGLGGVDVVTEQAFDARGRLKASTSPHLATSTSPPVTTYEYDYLNRPTRIVHPDGAIAERQYASGVTLAGAYRDWISGLLCPSSVEGACGVDVELSTDTHAVGDQENQNVHVRDHAGLVIRSIDGENVDEMSWASNYAYGPFNRLRIARDNIGATKTFVYDDYGHLISYHDLDAGFTDYTYNNFGEVLTSRDSNQKLRTYGHDELGRLTSIRDGDAIVGSCSAGTAAADCTTWVYDQGVNALGQLTESISPPSAAAPQGQRVHYEYEPPSAAGNRGLLKTLTYALDDQTYSFQFGHDSLGRMGTIDYPSAGGGTSVRAQYGYDPLSGALTSVSENATANHPVWKVDSAFEGYLVEQATFGNGAISTFDYDPERHWLTKVQTGLDAPGGNVTIQDLTYEHYGNGQVRRRLVPGYTRSYTYDALGRITTQNDFSQSGGMTTTFDYDSHGNLTWNRGQTNVFSTSKPHFPVTVGDNTYTPDAKGNVASREGPGVPGGVQTFSYTPFDLPRSITTGTSVPVEFEYTADGTRVVRRDANATHHYASQLYERSFAADGTTIEEHFRFVAGNGVVAEKVRSLAGGASSERDLYFHPDNVGTPETISDGTGNHVQQEFDAFGARISSGEATRIGFTGQNHDSDLDLIDMGGRVYDPLAGRFTTADPIIQAPFFSQGLNSYAYVFNDPINNTDPSGFATTRADIESDVFWGIVVAGWGATAAYRLGGSVGWGLAGGGLGGLSGYGLGYAGQARKGGGPFDLPSPRAVPVNLASKAPGIAANQARPIAVRTGRSGVQESRGANSPNGLAVSKGWERVLDTLNTPKRTFWAWLGGQIHTQISLRYGLQHPSALLNKTIGTAIAGGGGSRGGIDLMAKPDIFDPASGALYEIKVDGLENVAQREARYYVNELTRAGIRAHPGLSGGPEGMGTMGSFNWGIYRISYSSPMPGVITYRAGMRDPSGLLVGVTAAILAAMSNMATVAPAAL